MSARFSFGAIIIRHLPWFIAVGCGALAPAGWAASLPQAHEYQKVLRSYLAGLGEQDLAVEAKQFVIPATEPNPDESYKLWMLTTGGTYTYPPVTGVTLPASQFTLASIEGAEAILRPSGSADAIAWLAEWNHPCNPYHGSQGLKRRAFVLAAVDMVMLDALHEADPKGPVCRSDFLGGTLIWLANSYAAARELLPKEVRDAYETGLRKLVARLHQWGPTGAMTDMDLFAPVSLKYSAEVLRDAELEKLAAAYARRLFTEPRFFHPAGYFVDLGSFDATYNGISLYFTVWASLISDWAFTRDALAKAYRLRNHLMLPEPDGKNFFGPSHFSSRTSGDVAHDQWAWHYRDIGAAMITDEALYAATVPTSEDSRKAVGKLVKTLNAQLDAKPRLSQPWSESHWTRRVFAHDYYVRDTFAKLTALAAEKSPRSMPVFAENKNFVRAFEQVFLVAKFDNFGVILHTGPVPGEPEKDERMYGFGGGALSAFWTPQTGSVLLGRRRGYQSEKHDRYADWRLWPTHAITGLTAEGKVITSARQPTPEVAQKLAADRAEVIVKGAIPNRNAAQGRTLQGEIRYERRFGVSATGLEMETVIHGDGKDPLSELYETLPIFLREDRSQKDVSCRITFCIGEEWKDASTELTSQVRAVRVERFSGAIEIRFDNPRRVRLSPEEWRDFYQSSAVCRNLMIDLLENDGEPTPAGSRAVAYRIVAVR